METHFSLDQLADPDMRESERILRACVHCGFCTATCPTYLLLGDELDSPRGRIYLLKDMLENDKPASEDVVTHIDRCLSCLSCMTTCPSDVNYMHLVDHGRRRIEETYRRPLADRLLRRALGFILPRPGLFGPMLRLGAHLRRLGGILPEPLRRLLSFVPQAIPRSNGAARPRTIPAQGPRRKRVALLTGCVQQTLAPEINRATVDLLSRHGCEVVIAGQSGCCGALTHHLGQDALDRVRANVDAWSAADAEAPLDAIVVNASGCGTMIKDYGFLLRSEPAYAAKAQAVSALARDVTELIDEIGLREPVIEPGRRIAYQNPCSMQHGQKIVAQPAALLARAGFSLAPVADGHLCCGSAGTYNLLQPDLAATLGDRKAATLAAAAPQVVASGNIGCMMQLAPRLSVPMVHTVELLDWATGGPEPAALRRAAGGLVGGGTMI